MELSQRSLEASCKLAFELGQAKAQEDWDRFHEKEASLMGGVVGGVKGFFRGQGLKGISSGLETGFKNKSNRLTEAATAARKKVTDLTAKGTANTTPQFQAAEQAAAKAEQAAANYGSMYGAAGTAPTTLRQTFTQPFKNVYQRYSAGRYGARETQLLRQQGEAQKALNTAKAGSPEATAAQETLNKVNKSLSNHQGRVTSHYGFNDASHVGQVLNQGYQGLPTALGYAAIPAGAAYLGYQALPGGNTYNVTSVQPQAAPHQYYLNQMSRMFS